MQMRAASLVFWIKRLRPGRRSASVCHFRTQSNSWLGFRALGFRANAPDRGRMPAARIGTFALLATALMLTGVAASAATLEGLRGSVLVNTGQGFRAPVSGAILKAGDAVMVGDGGRAIVRYDNGCRERVLVGKVVVVQAEDRCVCGGDDSAHSGDSELHTASLRRIGGTVLADAGQGYGVAAEAHWLKTGDRVKAASGGSAVIRYQDGCEVRVDERHEVVVRRHSPCACGLVDQNANAGSLSGVDAALVAGAAAAALAGGGGYLQLNRPSRSASP